MPAFNFLRLLIEGAWVTLQLALCAATLGIIIGIVALCGSNSRFKIIRWQAKAFIFLIRSIPELLVLFFIYFGITILISDLLDHYVDINPFIAGVSALSIIFGAYASQVFRGALDAIPLGQKEAGLALGLTSQQIFWKIELPQAIRHALPGLGNLWLVLLKDTAIVMLIGLTDLMSQAKIAASATHEPFTFYLLAACIYLFMTALSQHILNYLTHLASRHLS